MTALQLAADILAGVFLCLLFAAVYVSVKIHEEEKSNRITGRSADNSESAEECEERRDRS